MLQAAVSSGFFTQDQVETLEPSNSVDETIDKILDYECKVLITDYRLYEYNADVEFSGIDLIMEFQKRFLCFLALSPQHMQSKPPRLDLTST